MTTSPSLALGVRRHRAAISVREPWCSLLLLDSPGRKDVENRWGQTQHRGRLYLHASKTIVLGGYRETMSQLYQAIADSFFPALTWEDIEHLEDPKRLKHLGCFRGVVNLVDITLDGAGSPWATEDNQYKWHVTTPYRIDEPVPFDGQQGAPWYFPWDALKDSSWTAIGDGKKT